MKSRALCLVTFLCFAALGASAQDNSPFAFPRHDVGGPGSMARALTGVVHTFDGKPVRNARVEVRSLGTAQTVATGYTSPNGSFEFENIPQGTYEVVATAGVDEARQRVELNHPDGGMRLVLPGPQAGGDTSGNGMVSVAQLKIPDKAKSLFHKAEECVQKNKLAEARDRLDKALQVFPKYAQALTLRGVLNLQANDVQAARNDLEQAVKDDYSYGMSYVVLGATYNVMKRYDDSVRTLQRGIALMPSSWQPYFEMSKALLGQGQFAAALRQVNKAGQFAPPDYGPIHLVRAHALLGLKDYNNAVAELEQFLGSKPSGADSASARETLNQVRAFMASNNGK